MLRQVPDLVRIAAAREGLYFVSPAFQWFFSKVKCTFCSVSGSWGCHSQVVRRLKVL